TPYRADLEAANYSAAIEAGGLVEMAYVAEDASCGGAGVWLARKP
ncbi:class I SAM-dependent methyltransferase, partial [Pseudomonas protegens]